MCFVGKPARKMCYFRTRGAVAEAAATRPAPVGMARLKVTVVEGAGPASPDARHHSAARARIPAVQQACSPRTPAGLSCHPVPTTSPHASARVPRQRPDPLSSKRGRDHLSLLINTGTWHVGTDADRRRPAVGACAADSSQSRFAVGQFGHGIAREVPSTGRQLLRRSAVSNNAELRHSKSCDSRWRNHAPDRGSAVRRANGGWSMSRPTSPAAAGSRALSFSETAGSSRRWCDNPARFSNPRRHLHHHRAR